MGPDPRVQHPADPGAALRGRQRGPPGRVQEHSRDRTGGCASSAELHLILGRPGERLDRHSRCAPAQPEEPRPGDSARPLVVITGLSGSQTPLAFDTIYAEGEWRYVSRCRPTRGSFLDRGWRSPTIDSGRAFAGDLDRAEDHAEESSLDGRHDDRGLRSPASALRDHRGHPHCYQCGREISSQTVAQIAARVLSFRPGRRWRSWRRSCAAGSASTRRSWPNCASRGSLRARIDGASFGDVALARTQHHTIEVVVDRLRSAPASTSV